MSTRNLLHFAALAIGTSAFCQPALAASTERVSVSSTEVQGNNTSSSWVIRADGRFVAFYSSATNLVPGDTNGVGDVFVRDRKAGTTERVSVSSAEAQGNGESTAVAISADGRYVSFWSYANNLVTGDTGGAADVFVRDRLLGKTELISVSSAEEQGNNSSCCSALSASGRFVAFLSYASNLTSGDNNLVYDVFVRDRQLGTTERVSISSAGAQANGASGNYPSISADGRFVTFQSTATNLVPGDTNIFGDVFVRDRKTGTTERVSVTSAEAQAQGSSGAYPSISADGRFVAFLSFAANLVAGDSNNSADIFVRDRQLGTTERVSVSNTEVQGNGASGDQPMVSVDGRYVVFESVASNLVASDFNADHDTFLRDRQRGTTERISVSSAGAQGNRASATGAITPDGRFAVFSSYATTLVPGDTNAATDVFVRDRGLQPEKPANDLLVDFGATGLWQRLNDRTWGKILSASPIAIAKGDLDGNRKDEEIASFTGLGLLARYNNAGAWVKLHSSAPTRLIAGDFDANGIDDLVADLGATGI